MGGAPADDQLRDRVRHQRARAARVPPRRGAGPVIETVREALGDARAWVVGGAVRDRLLGRRAADDDIDVVLEGDARPAARRIARAAGGAAFELSDVFGGWRVVGPGQAWQGAPPPPRGGSPQGGPPPPDPTRKPMAPPPPGGGLLGPPRGPAGPHPPPPGVGAPGA